MLLNFPVQSVTSQCWIVLPDLQLFGFELFIAARHVAGGRLAFLARFRAFNSNRCACHKIPVLNLTETEEVTPSLSRAFPLLRLLLQLPRLRRCRRFRA